MDSSSVASSEDGIDRCLNFLVMKINMKAKMSSSSVFYRRVMASSHWFDGEDHCRLDRWNENCNNDRIIKTR